MYPIIECARANVSEGEMIEALQRVFGSYTRVPGLLSAAEGSRAAVV